MWAAAELGIDFKLMQLFALKVPTSSCGEEAGIGARVKDPGVMDFS